MLPRLQLAAAIHSAALIAAHGPWSRAIGYLGSRGGARAARSAPGFLVWRFQREGRRTGMLRVVAPRLLRMLHINSLTINVVAGVAGF
jgi:hypothetical protein